MISQILSTRKRKISALIVATICTILFIAWCTIPRPLFEEPTSAVLYASDGDLLSARIATDGQWRFPESDSLPDKISIAIVEAEDHRFHYHLGVDPIAIARAVYVCIRDRHISQGGSTITMQVARLARKHQTRTLWQKLVEATWATVIELTHTKAEILRLYASHAPMGGNVVGVEAASRRYFGRSVDDLTWAEAATLAVLPNAPSIIHMSKSRTALLDKRNRLLQKMHDHGIISDDDLSLAMEEPLPGPPRPLPDLAPHLLDNLATKAGRRPIKTTLSTHLQSTVRSIANNHAARLRSQLITDIGVIVADVNTGEVLAYVGNTSLKSETSSVDMIRAERSTGSILKPMLYVAALSDGEITPKNILADTPLDIGGFRPVNYSHTYSGAVQADEALRRSLNVPMVRLLTDFGIARFIETLKQMGMTTLHYSEDHYGASLILGGAEATLWDMAGIYSQMANRVLHPEATSFAKLSTTKANTPTNFAKHITSSATWCALDAMTGLNRPEEESEWQSFSSSRRIAWKTGTSYGNRDAWALGVTPSYVVGVWVGCAQGMGRAGMTGVSAAGPVMLDVFGILPAASQWFQPPLDEMEFVPICRHSGMKASDICMDVDTALVPMAALETDLCKYCQLIHLSADGKWRVNSDCASLSDIRTESRFVLPPTMDFYYRTSNTTYKSLPPVKPDCASSVEKQFSIVYPQRGNIIVSTRSFDGKEQGFVCSVASRQRGLRLYWHLDGQYVGKTTIEHSVKIAPSIGFHTLTVVSESGQSDQVRFEVR